MLDLLVCGCVLTLGFIMFVLGHVIDPYIEPLITCMVGGFVVANYTSQRKELMRVMDMMTASVMIAFFTLTGAALNLHSLSQTILISSVIFVGRIGGIIIGSWLGGYIAGIQLSIIVSWMNTLPGWVTLGLAKKIYLENRVWGGGFATVIIACVVLNQLVGPPLMKWAIEYIGEHNLERRSSVASPKVFPIGTLHPKKMLGLQLHGRMTTSGCDAHGAQDDGRRDSTPEY